MNNHQCVYLYYVYSPSGDEVAQEIYISKVNWIIDRLSENKIVLCGEFNMPNLKWKFVDDENYLSTVNTDLKYYVIPFLSVA